MKRMQTILALISVAALTLPLALAACSGNEGPAENAGEKIDNGVEWTGEKIEDAGEAVQDAAN